MNTLFFFATTLFSVQRTYFADWVCPQIPRRSTEAEYDVVKSRLLDIQRSWRDEWHGFRIVSL